MDCVVAYLESIHWESAEIPFDLAEIKLVRIVEALELLCSSAKPAKQPVVSVQKENVSEPPAEQPTASKFGPEMEVYMDKVFAAATKTTAHKKDDKPLKPPRKKPALSEESEDDFNIDDLDQPATPAGRRKRKLVVIDSDDEPATTPSSDKIAGAALQETVPTVPAADTSSKGKNASSHGKASANAPPPKKAKTTAAPSAPKVSVIEVDDDSDDDTVRKPAKRGPKSDSRSHFHHPVAVKVKGNLRWEFKCKHCTRKRTDLFPFRSFTVERTRGTDQFDDEPKQPPLGGLRTHLNNHGDDLSVPGAADLGDLRGVSAATARLMEAFIHEGRLRPGSNPTQKGFVKVFSAWILEDDLPFTTGETGGIQRLFNYMKSKFLLPSDTTVRNTLAKIYLEIAATNDVLIRVLSRILMEKFDIQFVPENSQIRCLAHVVNLVVQKILATLNEADDPDVIDYYLPNKDLPFHYDPDTDTDLRDLETEEIPQSTDGQAEDEEDDEVEVMTAMADDLAKLSPLQKVSSLFDFTHFIDSPFSFE
ncbi:hypothetical protein K438DRAFT_1724989 [Mycena galopus ATCC 62051]|nr:hypothetical protein K438DRAFT_1724989 [Mycena galopus ATCC 62051]